MKTLLEVKGVGAVTLAKLNKMGIKDIANIANFMPFNYVDLDAITDITQAQNGDYVLVNLRIEKANKPFRKGNFSCFKAFGVTDNGVKVVLVWYNSSFAFRFIQENKTLKCYGKLKIEKSLQIINPTYEVVEDNKGKLTGIKPIYPTRGHIPQSVYLNIVQDAMSDFSARSFIDDVTAEKLGLMDLTKAFQICHKPVLMAEIPRARQRIMLESLVKRIAAYRLVREISSRLIFYDDRKNDIENFIKTLPYALTESQDIAVKGIIDILLSHKPLNSMLVGDVGSGKTIVALIAAYFAVLSGKQAVIMVPTEILAEQHYNNFCKLLKNCEVNIDLLLGSTVARQKTTVKKNISNGVTDIIIGTHAVFSGGVEYKNLALVIVDEQHRFGVGQRTALLDKGKSVDVLTLSATPIPRSLRLVMFGDMDIINIDRRYANTNIKTALVGAAKRQDMFNYIIKECKAGKQAYIVVPRIFDDEGVEMANAEAIFNELTAEYGSEIKIMSLHGKMKIEEKQEALTHFVKNEVQILISTTVIEVGIDVPNASLMVIMGAERFGLATLHQLRGRIGRNGKEAYCFLYTEKEKEEEIVRLRTMVEMSDGISIAERDYELRGAGDWLGECQSGKDNSGFTPTIALTKEAKAIADNIDVFKHKAELLEYAEQLKLERVSLT